MTSLFPKAKTPSAPQAAAPPPSVDDAANRAEAGRNIDKSQGYKGTILTSGKGDESVAPTKKKTLLGD